VNRIELVEKIASARAFIADEIIPMERDPRCTPHGPTEELRAN
jgi:acyl-CoA dehydrogenase